MRAFQGLVEQLSYLQVSLNWWQILQQTVGETHIKHVMEYELPVVNLKTSDVAVCFSEQAEILNVQVIENSRTIVSVTLPVEVVLNLEQVMPEDVFELIKTNDEIDLAGIMNKLRLNGLTPQTVMQFENAEKHYKIWLQ